MSTILSNQSFQDFLNTALQTDNELSNEEQQREAIIQQADEMTEQAKQAALDAGASLLPLGTIELAKSVGGLYEKGSKAFNAAKAFKAARFYFTRKTNSWCSRYC
jgi:chitodextrinase